MVTFEKNGGTIGEDIYSHLSKIVKCLKSLGYSVESPAEIVGLSCAAHKVDLYAATHGGKRIILNVLNSEDPVDENHVIKLYAVMFDTKVDEAALLISSTLTDRAMELAKLYGVRIVDCSNVDKFCEELRDERAAS